jgi:hypothetical protein
VERMAWTNPPEWTPCRPTKTGVQNTLTVPPPLPAPTNYRIPRQQPASISPVRPPPVPRLMDVRSPPRSRRVHRHNPLAHRPSSIQRRLAPLSERIPHKLDKLAEDLYDYQRILEEEAGDVRRRQLEYRRRTSPYQQQQEELRKLGETISRLQRARRVLVAPLDNQ